MQTLNLYIHQLLYLATIKEGNMGDTKGHRQGRFRNLPFYVHLHELAIILLYSKEKSSSQSCHYFPVLLL